MRKIWNWLWSRPAALSAGVLLFIGIVAGAAMLGGTNAVVAHTSKTEFCLSCHEMADTVGKEWRESVHYSNPAGIRAECKNCHVPESPWTAKMKRKIVGGWDIYGHLRGTIDTPEKFEDKRLELAERVWARMKADGGKTCRSCHSYEAMDFHKQSDRAQEKMKPEAEKQTVCIECHTGVAHKRPRRDD